jgi:hypothetical protein
VTRKDLTRIVLLLCLFFQGAAASSSGGAPQGKEKADRGDRGGENFAVVIGIDRYERYPRSDHAAEHARAVAEKLRTSLGFADENVILLLDEQATRQAIKSALLEVIPKEKSVRDHDRIFVFFEGNAFQQEEDADNRGHCVVIPYDGDGRNLKETALPLWDLLVDASNAVPARNILFVLNVACPDLDEGVTPGRNGLMVSLTKPARQVIAMQGRAGESPTPAQRATFADRLLKGLGAEADQNRDGLVTATELAGFMNGNRPAGLEPEAPSVVLGHIPVESDNVRGDFAFVIGSRRESPGSKGIAIVDRDSFRHGSIDAPPFREKPVRTRPGRHEKGPAIAVDATNVFVGTVQEGEIIVCEYNVRNVGKQALKIFSVEPG